MKQIPTKLPENQFDVQFQHSQKQLSEIQAQVLPQSINIEDPESLKDSNIIVQILGEVTTLKNRMAKMENSRPKATITSNTLKMQEKFRKLKTKANVKWENLNNQINGIQASVDSLAARDAQMSQEIIRLDALLQSCSVSMSSIQSDVSRVQPEKFNLAVKKVKNDVEILKTAISALQDSTPSSQDIEELSKKVARVQKQICEFPEIQTKLDTQKKDLELVKNALKKSVPITATSEEDANEGAENDEKLSDNLAIVPVSTTQMLIEAQTKHEAEISAQRLEIDELKASLSKYSLKAPVDTKLANLTEQLEKLQATSTENFSTLQNEHNSAIEAIQRELGDSKSVRSELDKMSQTLLTLNTEYHEHQASSTAKVDALTNNLREIETSLSNQIQTNNTAVNKRIDDNITDIKQQILEIRSTLNDRLRDTTERLSKQVQDHKEETQKEHEFIQNNLQTQFNTLKETVNRQIQDYKLKVNEDLNDNKEKTSEQIKDIRTNTNNLLNQHQETISTKLSTYQGSMTRKVDDTTSSIRRELETYENATKNQLKEHRDSVEQRLQTHQEQTMKVLQENKENQRQSLKDSTEALNTRLNDVKESNDKQVKEIQDESRQAYTETKEENANQIKEYQNRVNEQLQTTLNDLNKQIKDFREEFERQLNENHQTLSNQVNDIVTKSDRWIKDTESSINDKLEETRKGIEKKLDDSNFEFYKKIEDTEKSVNSKLDQTQSKVDQQLFDSNKMNNENFTRQIVDTKQAIDREIGHTQESLKIANEGLTDLKPTHREINRLKMSIRMMGGEIYNDDSGIYPDIDGYASRQSSPRRSRPSSRQPSPPVSPKRNYNNNDNNLEVTERGASVDSADKDEILSKIRMLTNRIESIFASFEDIQERLESLENQGQLQQLDNDNSTESIKSLQSRVERLESLHKENEIYELEINDTELNSLSSKIDLLDERVQKLEQQGRTHVVQPTQAMDIVQPSFSDVEDIRQRIREVKQSVESLKNKYELEGEKLSSTIKCIKHEIKVLKKGTI